MTACNRGLPATWEDLARGRRGQRGPCGEGARGLGSISLYDNAQGRSEAQREWGRRPTKSARGDQACLSHTTRLPHANRIALARLRLRHSALHGRTGCRAGHARLARRRANGCR